jgi:hypothetical protein
MHFPDTLGCHVFCRGLTDDFVDRYPTNRDTGEKVYIQPAASESPMGLNDTISLVFENFFNGVEGVSDIIK